jgi:cell division septum initiation protein DivIVA
MSINAGRYGDPYSAPDSSTGDDVGRPLTPLGGPDDAPEGSPAAVRLLEMTARETDQWRADARSESAAIVAAARKEAEDLVRAAREQADRLLTSAREEAAQTANDARVEAYQVREETSAARTRHEEDVARLQEVASEHRQRLRRHLTEMLDRVDSTSGESSQ